MIETAKMSERGQIIIPKDIRNEIDASTDTVFAVSALDRETIIMKKIDTKKLVEDFRKLRQKARKLSSKEIEDQIHAERA